ncbi:MAG: NifU family protein [Pseudomonadota bacterium]
MVAARANTDDAPLATSLDALLKDVTILEEIVEQWDDQQQATVQALQKARDALNKEALSRLIRALKTDPAALASLKASLSDEVIYAVLRYHDIVKASVQERLEQALDSVRPYLATHGGNVEVVQFSAPETVTIRLLGSCDGCPAAGLTLSEGVEKAIKDYCPEITQIHKAKGGAAAAPTEQPINFVSPFANAADSGWMYAVDIEEVPEGDIKCIDLDGHSLLFSRVDQRVTCFENACSHLGMPMDSGSVINGILTCPHHHFEYSLQSGECLTAPEVQLQTHAVRVLGSQVEVKLT